MEFTVTQILPKEVGHERRIPGLWLTGPEITATLNDTTTCEDLIHEDCGLRAVECWHLRPYLPRGMRERYDAEQDAKAPRMMRHPNGLVWLPAAHQEN